ncbi:hypothetical protein HBB16_02350 [Pseudonocardia sp. MCCB 268]|nr:hypothetical protein [Pseudonocardia cytotoxica]
MGDLPQVHPTVPRHRRCRCRERPEIVNGERFPGVPSSRARPCFVDGLVISCSDLGDVIGDRLDTLQRSAGSGGTSRPPLSATAVNLSLL